MSMISFNTTVSQTSASSGRCAAEWNRGAVSDATLPARVDTIDLSQASQQTNVRQDLVARMRASIASGQYERDIDAKLDVVADRLGRELDELA
jgi:hypothetical protein